MNPNQIEIPLSKKKMIVSFLGSLAFCAIGILFLIRTPRFHNPILNNAFLVQIIGVIALLFFGAIAVTILIKLTKKQAGLVINEEGITDFSSGISAGLIPWEDIVEIKTTTVVNQQFLMIITKNPEAYIKRQKGVLKRKTMLLNYKSYGSPICISANALQTNFDTLYQTVIEKYNNYKEVVI